MQENIKLLIFPVSRYLIDFIKISIKNILLKNKVKNYKVISENDFLVLEVRDYLQVSQWLRNCSGIKRIGISVSTSVQIRDILDMIAYVADRTIYSKNHFKINVFSENPNIISRDIEFIATGLILEKFNVKKLTPFRTHGTDVTNIYCFILKSHCYVIYKFIEGAGGLPLRYIKKKIFCVCYNNYSINSIEKISNYGFIPQILIIYSNRNSLTKYLKDLHHIFLKMENKRISVKLLKIAFSFDNNVSNLNELNLFQSIIPFTDIPDVLIPFSFYTHPLYMVEKIINLCYQNRKIPWLPLMFLDINKDEFVIENNEISNIFQIKNRFSPHPKSKNKKEKFSDRLNLKNIKTVSFIITSSNIRPNYIDNILNSI